MMLAHLAGLPFVNRALLQAAPDPEEMTTEQGGGHAK